ncbi:ygcG, partial [Symbiodinium sp. KB8]
MGAPDSSPLRATPPRNVLDAEGILSPAIVQELQHDLELMQRQHGVQAVVVTVPGSTTTTPKAHATRIFQKWGIGSPLFHDGLLIMLSSVGGGSTKDLGLTHLLTKEWLGDLLQQVMVPNFRQGKYSTALVAGVRFTNRFLSAALDRGRAVTVTLDEGECAALNKVTASSARNLHTPLTKHIVPASMAPLAKRKLQAVMSGDASVLRLPGGMADPHRAWQSSRQEHGHAEPGFWQVWGNLFVLIGLGVALLRVMYDLEWGSKDSSEPEPEAPPDDLRAVPNQLVTARVLELTGDSTRTLRRTLVDLLDAAHTFDTQVFGNSDDLQLLTGVKPDASAAL